MRRSVPPLRVEPGFSLHLFGFVLATHGLALAAALLSGWPGVIKGACAIAVAASALLALDRHLWRPAVVALHLTGEGVWRLRLRDGREGQCELCADSVVTTGFVLLGLSTPWGRQAMIVLRDSVDGETYRKLRVALRLYGDLRKSPTSGDGTV